MFVIGTIAIYAYLISPEEQWARSLESFKLDRCTPFGSARPWGWFAPSGREDRRQLTKRQCLTLPCCHLPLYSVVSDSLRSHGLCSPTGCCVHGIVQKRILVWVAVPFSRGSPRPRDQTWDLPHCRQITIWATSEALYIKNMLQCTLSEKKNTNMYKIMLSSCSAWETSWESLGQ